MTFVNNSVNGHFLINMVKIQPGSLLHPPATKIFSLPSLSYISFWILKLESKPLLNIRWILISPENLLASIVALICNRNWGENQYLPYKIGLIRMMNLGDKRNVKLGKETFCSKMRKKTKTWNSVHPAQTLVLDRVTSAITSSER